MKVIYTDTHWLELFSRLASKRISINSEPVYIGLGCSVSSCTRHDTICSNCPLSFNFGKK